MAQSPIKAIKEIIRGPAIIAAAIILLIIGVIWAAHHDQMF